MPISSKLLVDKANNAFNTTTLTAIVSAQNCAAIDASLTIYKVSTFADLPNPVLNTGRMIFVESLNKYLYSNGIEWTDNIESPSLILWTWGRNSYGQLGTNNISSRSSPSTTAGGGTNWSQISNGTHHTCGTKTDGTLWTWGNNVVGQLGENSSTNRSSPGTTSNGGTNWKYVNAGGYHSAGIKIDGTLWTWGNNFSGQLGDNTTTNRSSPVTTAGGGINWNQVAGGYIHSTAIKIDGTLWTWGYNFYGQLGENSIVNKSSPVTTAGGGTNWMQVSAGGYHSAVIKTDGTLWTWGRNNYGQLGNGTITDRSSPGTTAGGGTNWSQVSCGMKYNCAIKTDGTLWTWGKNDFGQLGDNSTVSRSSPGTTAGGGTNWSYVNGGMYHICTIKTDGTLWTWGYNFYGQLGDGTTTNRSSPGTTAGGGTTWVQISGGKEYTTAIG